MDWKECKIGEVCEVGSSTRIYKKEYEESGIPFYRGQEIIKLANNENIDDPLYISEERYKELKNNRSTPQKGDILMISIGATLGVPYYVDHNKPFYFKDGNVTWFSEFSDKIESKYLYNWLRSDYGNKVLWTTAIGSAQPALTLDALRKIEIELPPLQVQKEIASILSAFDDLIENNTRRIEILEEMARRIYREWFVHFRYPGHEDDELVDSGTELGEIPEGWEVKKIGEICELMYSGGTPLRRENKFWENGTIKWFKTKELQDNFLFESEEKINELALEDSSAKEFLKDTILMAIYGSPTVGRLGITTERSSCNQAALGMIADKEYCSQIYLYHVLYNLREYFNTISQGAAQQNISKTIVNKTDFLLAPKELIDKFDGLVEPIFQLNRNLTRKNIQLEEARDLLLPKLISGKINLK